MFYVCRLTDTTLNSEGGSTFLPPCPNHKAASINLVLNAKNSNDKNSTIDNKTLQKVKKTYIWGYSLTLSVERAAPKKENRAYDGIFSIWTFLYLNILMSWIQFYFASMYNTQFLTAKRSQMEPVSLIVQYSFLLLFSCFSVCVWGFCTRNIQKSQSNSFLTVSFYTNYFLKNLIFFNFRM